MGAILILSVFLAQIALGRTLYHKSNERSHDSGNDAIAVHVKGSPGFGFGSNSQSPGNLYGGSFPFGQGFGGGGEGAGGGGSGSRENGLKYSPDSRLGSNDRNSLSLDSEERRSRFDSTSGKGMPSQPDAFQGSRTSSSYREESKSSSQSSQQGASFSKFESSRQGFAAEVPSGDVLDGSESVRRQQDPITRESLSMSKSQQDSRFEEHNEMATSDLVRHEFFGGKFGDGLDSGLNPQVKVGFKPPGDAGATLGGKEGGSSRGGEIQHVDEVIRTGYRKQEGSSQSEFKESGKTEEYNNKYVIRKEGDGETKGNTESTYRASIYGVDTSDQNKFKQEDIFEEKQQRLGYKDLSASTTSSPTYSNGGRKDTIERQTARQDDAEDRSFKSKSNMLQDERQRNIKTGDNTRLDGQSNLGAIRLRQEIEEDSSEREAKANKNMFVLNIDGKDDLKQSKSTYKGDLSEDLTGIPAAQAPKQRKAQVANPVSTRNQKKAKAHDSNSDKKQTQYKFKKDESDVSLRPEATVHKVAQVDDMDTLINLPVTELHLGDLKIESETQDDELARSQYLGKVKRVKQVATVPLNEPTQPEIPHFEDGSNIGLEADVGKVRRGKQVATVPLNEPTQPDIPHFEDGSNIGLETDAGKVRRVKQVATVPLNEPTQPEVPYFEDGSNIGLETDVQPIKLGVDRTAAGGSKLLYGNPGDDYVVVSRGELEKSNADFMKDRVLNSDVKKASPKAGATMKIKEPTKSPKKKASVRSNGEKLDDNIATDVKFSDGKLLTKNKYETDNYIGGSKEGARSNQKQSFKSASPNNAPKVGKNVKKLKATKQVEEEETRSDSKKSDRESLNLQIDKKDVSKTFAEIDDLFAGDYLETTGKTKENAMKNDKSKSKIKVDESEEDLAGKQVNKKYKKMKQVDETEDLNAYSDHQKVKKNNQITAGIESVDFQNNKMTKKLSVLDGGEESESSTDAKSSKKTSKVREGEQYETQRSGGKLRDGEARDDEAKKQSRQTYQKKTELDKKDEYDSNINKKRFKITEKKEYVDLDYDFDAGEAAHFVNKGTSLKAGKADRGTSDDREKGIKFSKVKEKEEKEPQDRLKFTKESSKIDKMETTKTTKDSSVESDDSKKIRKNEGEGDGSGVKVLRFSKKSDSGEGEDAKPTNMFPKFKVNEDIPNLNLKISDKSNKMDEKQVSAPTLKLSYAEDQEDNGKTQISKNSQNLRQVGENDDSTDSASYRFGKMSRAIEDQEENSKNQNAKTSLKFKQTERKKESADLKNSRMKSKIEAEEENSKAQNSKNTKLFKELESKDITGDITSLDSKYVRQTQTQEENSESQTAKMSKKFKQIEAKEETINSKSDKDSKKIHSEMDALEGLSENERTNFKRLDQMENRETSGRTNKGSTKRFGKIKTPEMSVVDGRGTGKPLSMEKSDGEVQIETEDNHNDYSEQSGGLDLISEARRIFMLGNVHNDEQSSETMGQLQDANGVSEDQNSGKSRNTGKITFFQTPESMQGQRHNNGPRFRVGNLLGAPRVAPAQSDKEEETAFTIERKESEAGRSGGNMRSKANAPRNEGPKKNGGGLFFGSLFK